MLSLNKGLSCVPQWNRTPAAGRVKIQHPTSEVWYIEMPWILCLLLLELNTCCETCLWRTYHQKKCAFSDSLDFCVTLCWKHHCAASGTQSRRSTEVSKSSSCRCWEMMEKDGLKFNKYRIYNKICQKNQENMQQYNTDKNESSWKSNQSDPCIIHFWYHHATKVLFWKPGILNTRYVIKQHPINIGVGKITNPKTSKNIRFASDGNQLCHQDITNTRENSAYPMRVRRQDAIRWFHPEVILDLKKSGGCCNLFNCSSTPSLR